MKNVGKLLTILLVINCNFASPATISENFRIEVISEISEQAAPLKSSLNIEKIGENFAEQTVSQPLNLNDKEMVEVVLNAVYSEESSTTVPLMRGAVPQDSNLHKSQLVNVSTLTKNSEDVQGNEEKGTGNLVVKTLGNQIQNSNFTGSQIISNSSPTKVENCTNSFVEIEAAALTGNERNQMAESQNFNVSHNELVLENLPDLLKMHKKITDSSYEIAPKDQNILTGTEYVSTDLKNLSNYPENTQDNKEESSKAFSSSESFQNSNFTSSVLLQIVLKDKPKSEYEEQGTATNDTNTKSNTNSFEQSENFNELVNELSFNKSSHLLGKPEEGKDSVYDSSKFVVHKNAKTITDKELNAELTNSLDTNIFHNSNFTTNANNSLNHEDEFELTREKNIPPSNSSQDNKDSEEISTGVFVDKISKAINEYKIATKSFNSFEVPLNSTSIENDLVRIVLKDVGNLTKKAENFLEISVDAVAIMSKLNTSQQLQNPPTSPERDLVQIPSKEVTNLTTQSDNSSESSDEANDATTAAAAVSNLSINPLNSWEQSQNSVSSERDLMQITSKEAAYLTNHPKNTLEVDDKTTTTSTAAAAADVTESTTKPPSIGVEEYAVNQMNFILDHLLLETQEFVANVLQASINSNNFRRDNLKRYAEALNRVLNPIRDNNDYSDEVIEKNKSQDEIYEEIVRKLNFLKSKPSKYLQKYLPVEWIKDFRDKKVESTIWLDKATEQMHQELNVYISEEEDNIKYQYFNETFDDISRATEIHHKLALLADLVKIVKNKKELTFMDLYMQT